MTMRVTSHTYDNKEFIHYILQNNVSHQAIREWPKKQSKDGYHIELIACK